MSLDQTIEIMQARFDLRTIVGKVADRFRPYLAQSAARPLHQRRQRGALSVQTVAGFGQGGARTIQRYVDTIGCKLCHAAHFFRCGAGSVLQLAKLASEALGGCQSPAARIIGQFGDGVEPGFERIDPFGQGMAAIRQSRGHAVCAIFKLRKGLQQQPEAACKLRSGQIGCGRTGRGFGSASGDDLCRRFHVGAGGSAIAFQQQCLLLHGLACRAELPTKAHHPCFERNAFFAEHASNIGKAVGFGSAVAHEQEVGGDEQDQRHGHGGHDIRHRVDGRQGGTTAEMEPAVKTDPGDCECRKQ